MEGGSLWSTGWFELTECGYGWRLGHVTDIGNDAELCVTGRIEEGCHRELISA